MDIEDMDKLDVGFEVPSGDCVKVEQTEELARMERPKVEDDTPRKRMKRSSSFAPTVKVESQDVLQDGDGEEVSRISKHT